MSYWVEVIAKSEMRVIVELEDEDNELAAIETAKVFMNDYDSFEIPERDWESRFNVDLKGYDEVFKLHEGR